MEKDSDDITDSSSSLKENEIIEELKNNDNTFGDIIDRHTIPDDELFEKEIANDSITAEGKKTKVSWRPPRLGELTPMLFNTGLTHLGLEASEYQNN